MNTINNISIIWIIYSFLAAILGMMHIKNQQTKNIIWIIYGIVGIIMGVATLIYVITKHN